MFPSVSSQAGGAVSTDLQHACRADCVMVTGSLVLFKTTFKTRRSDMIVPVHQNSGMPLEA